MTNTTRERNPKSACATKKNQNEFLEKGSHRESSRVGGTKPDSQKPVSSAPSYNMVMDIDDQ